MLHRITYDGRDPNLPLRCEECTKFCGYLSAPYPGIDHEACPGPPQKKPVYIPKEPGWLVRAAIKLESLYKR